MPRDDPPDVDEDPQEASSLREKLPRSKKNVKYDPELQVSVPGGLESPELLKSFVHHVAYLLYQGIPVPSLRFQQRGKQLRSWPRTETDAWGDMAFASRLCHLPDIMHEHMDETVIGAFVERWQPETNSFHMPWGEMTITLHDVWMILGLNIQGQDMGPPSKAHQQLSRNDLKKALMAQAQEFFGVEGGAIVAGTVHAGDFRAHCQELPNDTHVAGFLLYLVGSCLFPDKSQHRLPIYYTPFVTDPSAATNYAWGTGVLAHVYRSLGECTRKEARLMSTCFTLIQAWVYQYFPMFRHVQSVYWDPQQPIPYAKKWDMSQPPNQTKNYRQELDGMRAERVEWMPYGPIDFNSGMFASSRFHGVISCLWVTEPYMPDRAARQFGRAQQIPRTPIVPIKAWRGIKISSYTMEYDRAQFAWEARNQHSLSLQAIGPPVFQPHQCNSDYMQWYLQHTHPCREDALGKFFKQRSIHSAFSGFFLFFCPHF